MNERIRELIKQAGGHFSTHNLMSNPVQHRESIELWDKNIEKFAELIVKECLDQLHVSDWDEDYDKGVYWSREQIKNHFGVEE